ncbi:MAG TPA: hypothetical protein VK840_05820 [Candidatus Dormibacteraeota bacterium]|jgi:hypothetical protein|nr:hypothetical protein [Candidatus Dormibacteraeota bacterium]
MKPKLILCLALVLSGVLFGCSTATKSFESTNLAGNDVDRNLTKQISGILTECQKIKPGMTRAELLKVFTTEGGLSTPRHRTFVYRGCPYIKVDVDFTLSELKQFELEERPADTISKISKPYLDWSVKD